LKTLAIIGSGDLGQQIAHYAIADNHYHKVVFFDDYSTENKINGIPIIGKTDIILEAYHQKQFDELLIGIGYKHLQKRKEIYEDLLGIIPFGKIIHSTVWIDSTAEIKAGCVIYPKCNIDANVVINSNTILNISCTIAHDTKIGEHCFLSPRVAIAGFVNIEECCVLGINSTIIDNINITANTQIGAGTVVIRNIEKCGLYVGNPHRFVR
jgi:sugar O-acyltransferase (sialic acid O-acetyltransferase NeuD family)